MKISKIALSLCVGLAAIACAPVVNAGSYFGKNKTTKTEEAAASAEAASAEAGATSQEAPGDGVEEVVVTEVPITELESSQMEAPTEGENFDASQGTSVS